MKKLIWHMMSQLASLLTVVPMGKRFDRHAQRMADLADMANRGRLNGKAAIVTGAASGIGRATALLFAKEGAKVVVADISAENGQQTVNEITAAGGTAVYVQTDVTSDTEVNRLMAKTLETYGRISVLVNSAGANIAGGIMDLTAEQWQRALDLNLSSLYRCCRYAIPNMIQDGGSIIIIASAQGVSGFTLSSGYAAAKGGAISLTRQLARDFAPRGIRVNSVSPGVILTPIFDPMPYRRLGFSTVAEYVPLGHIGAPQDVAFANLFLASDESSYITGVNLLVDGGMTMRSF